MTTYDSFPNQLRHGAISLSRCGSKPGRAQREAKGNMYITAINIQSMHRLAAVLAATILVLATSSCKHEQASPVVVHVLRDTKATFAARLRKADLQFALTKPRLRDGRPIIVATNEGDSFAYLFHRLSSSPDSEELIILDSEADIPLDAAVQKQLGDQRPVCGTHPAFIPAGVEAQPREAAESYLRFLSEHCGT
jgi:hypothetical protein